MALGTNTVELCSHHQRPRNDLIAEEISRYTQVADTVARLLNDAGKALSTDLDAAEVCLARASQIVSQERVRQVKRTSSEAGISFVRGGLAPWQVQRVIAHIDANIARKIRIGDFLELTNLSGSHFNRAFRSSFGESPYSFIIGRRIEHAQKMMLATEEPLCDIALRCGLCDQAHLSRLFRRAVGISPNIWRRVQKSMDCAQERLAS